MRKFALNCVHSAMTLPLLRTTSRLLLSQERFAACQRCPSCAISDSMSLQSIECPLCTCAQFASRRSTYRITSHASGVLRILSAVSCVGSGQLSLRVQKACRFPFFPLVNIPHFSTAFSCSKGALLTAYWAWKRAPSRVG